jgi:ribosomal-protein-serine acetyltransferase
MNAADPDPVMPHVPTRLEAARVTLRAVGPGMGERHQAAIAASLPELSRWLAWARGDCGVAAIEAWCRTNAAAFVRREAFNYIIVESDTFIGGCGLVNVRWDLRTAEIGYWLRSDRTGCGLMSEAVVALRDAFCPTPLRRIELRCGSGNHASAAVARRCGFAFEGTSRGDVIDADGRPRDTHFFGYVA